MNSVVYISYNMIVARWLQDLLVYTIVLFLSLVESYTSRSQDRWDTVSVRYGLWYDLPPYQSKAFLEGYKRLNDVCKTNNYHGFLFQRGSNTKAMPIYDLNGNLAGIQAAIPGNMRGYNSRNESIELPPVEVMPPLLEGFRRDSRGVLYYTVTAYFKHPQLICSPVGTSKGVSPGRGLYIQMSHNPENEYLHIHTEERYLPSVWKKGNCLPMMGTHYFMNMSNNLPCEKTYPVFLMYNMEGYLAAFGWVFQGRPDNFYSDDGMGWFHITPLTYPFLFDTSQLPNCMMNEDFQMFGIHVYLQDPKKLTCLPVTSDNRDNRDTVNSSNVIPRTNRKQRIGGEYEKGSKSESYEIDVIEYKSSAVGVLKHSFSVLLILIVLSNAGMLF